MLWLYLLLEPVKRVLSAVLYPLAYALRRQLRTGKVMRPEYLYEPTFFPLWLMLDDSIRMETGEDCARQDSKYPAWVLACGWTWLRCYWWSAIRNSFVNFNNYAAYRLGKFERIEASFGAASFADIRARRAGWRVERRRFSGGVRLYCEFYLLRRWFQIGWLAGDSPRFEIDLFKDK
jgi:hypothetical protein